MPGGKSIVFALGRIGKTAEAPEFAVGLESVSSPGKKLVSVGLVPHIPHNTVIWGIENIMHRHGELHCTERRGEMPRIARQRVYKESPYVGTYTGKRLHRELPQISRTVDGIEQQTVSAVSVTCLNRLFYHSSHTSYKAGQTLSPQTQSAEKET